MKCYSNQFPRFYYGEKQKRNLLKSDNIPSWKSFFFCVLPSSCVSTNSLFAQCWTLHRCEHSKKWENHGTLELSLNEEHRLLEYWSIAHFEFCCFFFRSKEPGQQRVKRWGFGMDEALKDPVGREQFLKFLESEFSSENLR